MLLLLVSWLSWLERSLDMGKVSGSSPLETTNETLVNLHIWGGDFLPKKLQ